MSKCPLVISTCFQFDGFQSVALTGSTRFEHHPSSQQKHSAIKMRELLSRADIAVVGDDPVGAKELEEARNLSLIVRWGAGTDNVDFEECARRGIKVVNTPGLFGEDVADMAIGLAIGLVRGVVSNDRDIRSGEWPKTTAPSFRSLSACVLGLGTVGREVCRILLAFGLDVKGFDVNSGAARDLPIGRSHSIYDAARGANLCFVTLPLTSETHNSVGQDLLMTLEPPSFLVNVSRGEIVNETDLLAMLQDGTLSGAALDVFRSEPVSSSQPHRSIETLVMTSHNSSNTYSSIQAANNRTEEHIASHLGLDLM